MKLPSLRGSAKTLILRTVHDLRNPISGILSASEYLLEDRVDMRDEHLALLRAINSSSQFMLRLVDEMFHISTSEAKIGRLHLLPTSLVSLVKYNLLLNQKLAERKRVRLALATRSEAPVLADPPKLYQVIDRLVANAIEFSDPDGKVEIRVGVRGAWTNLSVRYSGIGIPSEKLQTALGRSQKSQGSDRQAPEPVASLATAEGIVQGHGGELKLNTKLGKGSTFTLILRSVGPSCSQDRTELSLAEQAH